MKRTSVILAVLAAGGALTAAVCLTNPPAPVVPAAAVTGPPPTSTLTDAAVVFQKAFWRRPASGDTILHAERREWADASGVQKWQWFVAVEPSPELVRYLREDNAFSLSPATRAQDPANAPEWFRVDPADGEVLQAPGGHMQLFFSRSQRLLLATDTGGGFRPGAPDLPPPAPPQTASTGRLPLTSPPPPSTP